MIFDVLCRDGAASNLPNVPYIIYTNLQEDKTGEMTEVIFTCGLVLAF